MGDLCEFTFIDGPKNATEPPLKYFVDKGITPPFKKWFTGSLKKNSIRSLPDGSIKIAAFKS